MSDSNKPGVMTQPIYHLFSFLKTHSRIQIWLYDNSKLKIEGTLIGFDEYMNLVLDDAQEVWNVKIKTPEGQSQTQTKKENIGRIMLKGDNVALVRRV